MKRWRDIWFKSTRSLGEKVPRRPGAIKTAGSNTLITFLVRSELLRQRAWMTRPISSSSSSGVVNGQRLICKRYFSHADFHSHTQKQWIRSEERLNTHQLKPFHISLVCKCRFLYKTTGLTDSKELGTFHGTETPMPDTPSNLTWTDNLLRTRSQRAIVTLLTQTA